MFFCYKYGLSMNTLILEILPAIVLNEMALYLQIKFPMLQ